MATVPSTTFHLRGDIKTRRVWLNDKELLPDKSQKVRNHSPDGFNWGYGGSGPAQLALAICIELFGQQAAQRIYQDFKFMLIAPIPHNDFNLTLTWEW